MVWSWIVTDGSGFPQIYNASFLSRRAGGLSFRLLIVCVCVTVMNVFLGLMILRHLHE